MKTTRTFRVLYAPAVDLIYWRMPRCKKLLALFLIPSLSILLGVIYTAFAQIRDEPLALAQQTDSVGSAPESGHASAPTTLAYTQRLRAACPSPTVKMGRRCVLEHDVTLSEALRLRSFTRLNCHGHTITSSVVGTGTANDQRSQPQVAILLKEAYGVKIYNCIIEGFDFGIFAIESKISEQDRHNPVLASELQNTILGNTINSRFAPISLMSVDDTHIVDNLLTYNSKGGVGLTVQRDSHMNRIANNAVVGNHAFPEALRVPGPNGISNPVLTTGGGGILITQINGPEPTLFNAVIDNHLYQLNATDSPVPNEEFTAHNLVEQNTIAFAQGMDDDGIALALPQHTIVRNNTIQGATNGIRAGIQTGPNGFARVFPGACSGNSSRLCLSAADCNIPGVDSSSQGTCTNPVPKHKNVFWLSEHTRILNNTVVTPVFDGIVLAAEDNLAQGNIVTGGTLGAGTCPGGIHLLGKHAIETTVITGNTISNVVNALCLTNKFQELVPSTFGAQISLNSFTGYTTAVRTSTDYTLPSELSVGQRGNFWGLSCPSGFDPTKVVPANPQVIDSHPFGDNGFRNRCS